MAATINIIHCPLAEVGSRLSGWLVPPEAYASRPNRVNGLPAGQATQNNSAIFVVCDRNVEDFARRIRHDNLLPITADEGHKTMDTVMNIWCKQQGIE